VNAITVSLPTTGGQTPATLYYEQDYNLMNFHPLNFLHLIRQVTVFMAVGNQHVSEEAYWAALDTTRTSFAATVAGVLPLVDMLVDAPSTRGFHRPFLSSFKQVYNVPCLMLRKTGQVPPVALIGTTPTHAAVTASNYHRILIVDDVFATGATAARVVDFLRGRQLPADVEFHVAAPLFISPTSQNVRASLDINVDDLPLVDKEVGN
jgi:hypothetical protein